MPTEKTTYLFSSSKQSKWNFSHLSAVNCCHIIITITLASRFAANPIRPKQHHLFILADALQVILQALLRSVCRDISLPNLSL